MKLRCIRTFSHVLSIGLTLYAAIQSVAGEGTSVPKPALIKDGETIAFLGDSITAGGGNYGGYCRLVMHGLKTKGIYANAIYAGVPGNKSSDMLLRLNGILRKKPDHLFLSVGVNDVWHTDPTAKIGVFKPSPGMGVKLEHFKIYVPEILDKCKAAGVNVIMSTFTQITEDPEHRLNKKAEAYNDFLRGLAKKRRLPIALLNEGAWAKINELKTDKTVEGNRNLISSDGIHPTAIGHQTMAKGILKAMGLTDDDLAVVEKEWTSSPQIMILGDRQVWSGGRTGGWRVMLLDCLNSGRDMVTDHTITSKKTTTPKLVAEAKKSINDRTKYILYVPPTGDLKSKTPIGDFEAAVRDLVDLAEKRKVKLVLSTHGFIGRDPESELNVAAAVYNEALQGVRYEMRRKVKLVDMADHMTRRLAKIPFPPLNLGDERFSHNGGKLMAGFVFMAFGGDGKLLRVLNKIWDREPSYTFKYVHRTTISVSLLSDDLKALHEVSERYHKLEDQKILDLGVDQLLYGDKSTNDKRLASYQRAGQSVDIGPQLRVSPDSEVQRLAIEEYTKKAGIDVSTFYNRAFLVGLYVLRKENPLKRDTVEK